MSIQKKYELIPVSNYDIRRFVPDNSFFRIRALRDFDNVRKGDIGGFVQSENNLSHDGNCWIFDNAKVYDGARVYDGATILNDAVICNSAKVYGYALIEGGVVGGYAEVYDNASVHNDAQVFDYAKVCDYAIVHRKARVFGHSKVCGNSKVGDDAKVFENAKIVYNAEISGRAVIYENAVVRSKVSGNARVFGDVEVAEGMYIICGNLQKISTIDLLRCSLGVHPNKDGIVTLFKRVFNSLTSEYDPNFQYPESGVVECPDYYPDPLVSCAAGLHFSINEFWPLAEGYKYLVAEVHVDDIICVLEGKARVKRAKIVNVIHYQKEFQE